MTREPIFVVGMPRSGTTLLAAMLAAHGRMSCGPETHFFRSLPGADANRLCAQESWPRAAVDFLESITFPAFEKGGRRTLLEKYRLERAEVEACLRSLPPSIPAILRGVTEPYMRARHKARWVEKTPEHLLQGPAVRRYYPGSPVIRIVRDPRDVAIGLTKVPWGVGSVVEGLFYCQRLEERSRAFFASDVLSCTVRFEDLVSSPAETLTRVCRFIGEQFEEAMLDTSGTGAEINSLDVPWKRKVREPVDTSRIAVWRTELNDRENMLAEAIVGDQLEAHGYPRAHVFRRAAEVWPGNGDHEKYGGALGTLAAEGVRFWKATPDERPGARVYLGDPGDESWFGHKRAGRVLKALPVFAQIARSAISDDELYWVPDGSDRRWSGYLSFVLKSCLARYRLDPDTVRPAGTE